MESLSPAHLVPLLPTIVACTLALMAGGFVKGVISIGLPLVGMPLLMLAIDVPTAVTLLMVPILLSNLVQAVEGPDTLGVFRRFWPLQLCLAIGTFIGTGLLATLDPRLLLLIVGGFTLVFGGLSTVQPHLAISPRVERWLGPPIGLLAGIVGGMSTLFGGVLALFVVGLKLPRDLFVKAVSMLYTTAGAFLLIGGAAHGTAGTSEIVLSSAAMVPVYGGMLIGQRVRHYLDGNKFRLVVLACILITGVNMIRSGLR
jgi:uncharacterized protein